MCQPKFVLILTKCAVGDQTSGKYIPYISLILKILMKFRISKCKDDEAREAANPDYDIFQDYDETPDDFSQCGRNASGKVLTITGDDGSLGAPETESQPGEFPHMCVIFQQREGFKDYIGGAALIARNKVITVAHKFYHK